MVRCNYEKNLQLFIITTTAIISMELFLTIPFATPLSFSFNGFSANDGDAMFYERSYTTNNIIQLNPPYQKDMASIGRATYAQPLQLWDKTSKKLADFTTHFTFVIDSNGSTYYGDGIAFFLAPEGSKIPAVTTGGSLGLTKDNEELNKSGHNSFVAVEFDIFQNPWDPPSDHVGIDIKSMNSSANAMWSSSITDGRESEAWITYNSSTTNLSVMFTGFDVVGEVFYQSLYYIVDLRLLLPDSVTFGFSGATGNASSSLTIHSWSFNSTLDNSSTNVEAPGPEPALAPGPTPWSPALWPPVVTNTSFEPNPKSENNTRLVVGVLVGGVISLGVLGLAWFGFWRRRSNHPGPQIILGFELDRVTGPRKYSYTQLAKATNNFSQKNKLGEGGFGAVYRGNPLTENGTAIAVKKVSRESQQGMKEYASEVMIISKLSHRNLVKLFGWCHEKVDELLLVYELMPNGSLDSHLFHGESLLTWGVRFNIAKGLAAALLYLHTQFHKCVLHRDIKSSNVMLDSDFNAKLGDFGLAKLIDHETESQTTIVAGTKGYMAPEYILTGKASKESDVFSFGVVVLEIACGRKSIDYKVQESRIKLVEWVWNLYGMGKLLEAADPKLGTDFDEQKMERMMIVGLWCAHPDSYLRPPILQVINFLNSEEPLPVLPPKMPVPVYSTPLVASGATTSDISQAKSSTYTSSKYTASSDAPSPSASRLYTN